MDDFVRKIGGRQQEMRNSLLLAILLQQLVIRSAFAEREREVIINARKQGLLKELSKKMLFNNLIYFNKVFDFWH